MRGKRIFGAVLMCVLAVFILTACGNNFKWGPVSGGPAASDIVSSNGGLAVQKGEYVYFVNGMVDYNAANAFGKPIKGSICRRKADDTENEHVDIIVPKIMVNAYTAGGIYIFGDRIYYPTPSTDRATSGAIQNSYLDFMTVKLDGTDTKRIIKLNPADNSDNIIQYKFYEVGGKVYFVYFLSGKLHRINVSVNSFKDETLAENVESFAFGDTLVYYAQKQFRKNAKDEDEEEKFNKLYKISPAGGDAVDITPVEKENVQPKYTVKKFDAGAQILFFTKSNNLLDGDEGLWGYRDNGNEHKKFTNNSYEEFIAVSWEKGLLAVEGDYLYRFTSGGERFLVYKKKNIVLYRITGETLFFGVRDTSYGDSPHASNLWTLTVPDAPRPEYLERELLQLTLNPVLSSWLVPDFCGGYIYFIQTAHKEKDDFADEGYNYYLYRIAETTTRAAGEKPPLEDEQFVGIHDKTEIES